jgi:hypothetical protein
VSIKSGTRLRCESCGSEVLVVKPSDPELTCCGNPLSPMAGKSSAASS